MGKRKEIKFLCKDGQTREGRQDGVMFWIRKDQKRERDGLPAFYVAANDIKGKGRTIYTAGHEYFTLEGAKELCQQIMAGEANLAERKARYAAEDIEKERRAVAAATEQAKAFRDKLEAAGISYHELMVLEQAHEDLGNMARNILLGWENGEGFHMSENTMLVPQIGINMEQATANCEELAKAIREITAGVLTTVNSFCRWIQRVAAEVAAQQEMETALRWASVDNRPLYNRYRHTKKKRIRKKYAKRILEWYRTEVAPC